MALTAKELRIRSPLVLLRSRLPGKAHRHDAEQHVKPALAHGRDQSWVQNLSLVVARVTPRFDLFQRLCISESKIVSNNGECSYELVVAKAGKPSQACSAIQIGSTLVSVGAIDVCGHSAEAVKRLIRQLQGKETLLFVFRLPARRTHSAERVVSKLVVHSDRSESPSSFAVSCVAAIADIACGTGHVLLRTAGSGLVYSFGDGQHGCLGHGDEGKRPRPSLITALVDHDCVAVACGAFHSVVVTTAGDAFSFGSDSHGQLGVAVMKSSAQWTPVRMQLPARRSIQVKIAGAGCGGAHSLLVSTEGELFHCGRDHVKQASDIEAATTSTAPRHVPVGDGEFVVTATGDEHHSAILTREGRVYTWGFGGDRAMGHKTSQCVASPTEVKKLRAYTVTQVVCGWTSTSCLTSLGDVWTWGRYERSGCDGEAADASEQAVCWSEPHSVACSGPQSLLVRQLATGRGPLCAVAETGEVFQWGTTEQLSRRDDLTRELQGSPSGSVLLGSTSQDATFVMAVSLSS